MITQTLDKISVGLSLLCAVHCLALPVLTLFSPVMLSEFISDATFHDYMLFVVIPTSSIALTLGCRKHKVNLIWQTGLLGILLLLFVSLNHDLFGEVGEKIASVVAASFIAFSHIQNYKLCRKLNCSCVEGA